MAQSKLVLLFPGQGAHDPGMLEGVKSLPGFAERYALVCDALDRDVAAELSQGNREFLNRNKVSSLLTLLVSSLSLDAFLSRLEAAGQAPPSFLAGYSVGQWMALHAADSLDFTTLVRVVSRRADLMDACFREVQGGMAAFIGISAEVLDDYLGELRAQGHFVTISNYNCLGQYSVAGTREAVELAVAGAERLKPRKAVVLPVAGGWHCGLLEAAAREFADYLRGLDLAPPAMPVIDNSSGDFLDLEPEAMKRSLARHLCEPVRWADGIKGLIAEGGGHFVEIGYGEVLTNFGFFLDRDAEFSAFYAG